MFFASNYFYAYQGSINTARFDGPTRALNAVLEGAGAIVGALMIGFFVLDSERIPRRTRGYIGLAVVILITIIEVVQYFAAYPNIQPKLCQG